MNRSAAGHGHHRLSSWPKNTAAADMTSFAGYQTNEYLFLTKNKPSGCRIIVLKLQGYRKCLSLAALICGSFLLLPTTAVSEQQSNLKFILEYSVDNELCKPITDVYNNEMQKLISDNHLIEHPHHGGSEPLQTDFEVTDPDAFTQAGLILPPIVAENAGNLSHVYDVNLPGNSGIRPLWISERMLPGTHDAVSTAVVLKAGTAQPEIKTLVDSAEYARLLPIIAKARDSDLTTEFFDDINSDSNFIRHVRDKWHQFRRDRNFLKDFKVTEGTTIRFFRKNNRSILIVDYAADLRWVDPRGVVLVYNLTSTGIKDVCVLWIDPTRSLTWMRDMRD